MQNQTKTTQQTKTPTTTVKTANKGAVSNAALLITSLQAHPGYVLCFYTLAIKVYAGLQEVAWRSGHGFVWSIATSLCSSWRVNANRWQ